MLLTERGLRGGLVAAIAVLLFAACAPPGGRTTLDVASKPPARPEAPARPAASASDLPKALPAPQPIILHAKTATVHGTGAHYESGPERDNIGFWTNPSDWVGWELTLQRPATFLVQITYACPPDSEGSDYEVLIGEHRLTGTVKSTGGWGKFVVERLGILDLEKPGKHEVGVKPLTKPKGAVMNLQAITLRPGRWERGLAAWWRFDEGDGRETLDEVGGKDTVAYARWTRGVSGTGLRFNGFSSYVSRPGAAAPRFRDAFSVEAWVKLLGEPKGWCAIVNQHRFPLGYYFGLDGAGDLALHVAAGGKWHACAAPVKLPVNRWTHVAATFDKQAGIALYVDGREVGRLALQGELSPADDADLLIGRHNHHPWVFYVAADEVRMFHRALSAEEVQKHCEWGRGEAKPPPMIAIRGVRPDRTTARVYERVTLDVDLSATCDNPFDADEASVEAAVATPSKKTFRVPGFLYQPFERRLEEGSEKLEAAGGPRWQVRLSFSEPGTHHLRVGAWDQTGSAMSEPLQIEVLPADVPGMVRRHPSDPRYFVTDRGETFFPIGANVCWGDARGTFAYDEWLPRYAENRANFFRVWLSPFWTTFGLNTAASGMDAVDLAKAWRLDHVLQTAEKLNLRAMLCIDSFNILRAKERSPGNYEDAPYVRGQGGPLDKPLDYFTNPWSVKAYRNRLRYLVARYGYSPSVFAWELWNEVNLVDDYKSEVVAAWHRDMARTLRGLDPWRHLITTSYAGPQGDPAVDSLPELDFVQSHDYGSKDMEKAFGEHLDAKPAASDRPHFHGEFGIDDGKKTAELDPTGIHLHNALYACVGQGQAGTPMSWWWDSYIHPRNLYPIFGSFARWIDGFDFVAQKARRAEVQVTAEDLLLKEPTTLKPVKGTWQPADFNQPLTAQVSRDGLMSYKTPLSDLLHGIGHHKPLHNPVTFELDVPEAATFGVEVKGISGFGDAILQITLDGKLALEKQMPLPQNPKDVVHDYDGVYSIALPAGKHTVKVENLGKDWLTVGTYKIPWLTTATRIGGPLRALGVVGEGRALLWVQNKLHTWASATAKDFKPTPVKGARLHVLGLRPGRWAVERFDTVKGQVIPPPSLPAGLPRAESRGEGRGEGAWVTEAIVGNDGKLTISLPDITWDAAFRLEHVGE